MIHDEIQLLPIEQVFPYPKNAKKHSATQVEKICRSIEMTGFDQPIVLDKNKVIIKGHGRWLAGKKLGLTDVPVIILDVSDDIANKARLADNKLAEDAEYDLNLLLEGLNQFQGKDLIDTGYNQDELNNLLEQLAIEEKIFKPKLENTQQFEQSFKENINNTPADTEDEEDDEDADIQPLHTVSEDDYDDVPVSTVRMVQLFLNTETQPKFLLIVEKLHERYKTENTSDCVMSALAELCGLLSIDLGDA